MTYGNLLFIAGVGAHFEGDIKAHTKHVLDQIQKQLENRRLLDGQGAEVQRLPERPQRLAGMNEIFQGRFGEEPPVRTTIAAAGGSGGIR